LFGLVVCGRGHGRGHGRGRGRGRGHHRRRRRRRRRRCRRGRRRHHRRHPLLRRCLHLVLVQQHEPIGCIDSCEKIYIFNFLFFSGLVYL